MAQKKKAPAKKAVAKKPTKKKPASKVGQTFLITTDAAGNVKKISKK